MKTFLACYAGTVVFMFLFFVFFGSYVFDGQHLFGSLLIFSLPAALVIYLFYRQSEELDELKARLDRLEGGEKKLSKSLDHALQI